MATMYNSSSSSSSSLSDSHLHSNSSASSPSPLQSLLSSIKLGPSIPTVSPSSRNELEYLFEDEYVPNGPSWGARICYGTGSTYLVGLSAGGLWGLIDGLRNPQGRASRRLRINCILNACTARGPFLGNSLGIVALLYNGLHGGIIKARGEKDDLFGAVGAAAASGAIFKSTAGLVKCASSGAIFGGVMLAYQLYKRNIMNKV